MLVVGGVNDAGFRIADAASEFASAMTRSARPLAVKSAAARALGRLRVGRSNRGAKAPPPVPKKTDTLLLEELATTRSARPSTLKSALATAKGLVPVASGEPGAATKVPSPFPMKTEAVLSPELAIARSGRVSPVKSVAVMATGDAP